MITTGDTIDRGDDTIKILDFFIENANQNIKHISGNHEEMNLIGDLRYVSKGDFRSFRGENSRKSAFEETGKYGNYLKNKKIIERIGDVIFLHGGLSKEIASKYKSIDEINRLYRENNYDQKVLYGTNGPL